MRIRFTEAPKGRDYKIGDEAEFNGPVPEGYARKYIARGWAVEIPDAAKVKAERSVPKTEAPQADAPTAQATPAEMTPRSFGGSRQGPV